MIITKIIFIQFLAKLYTRTYEKLQNTKLMLKHESTKTLINSDQ